MWAKQGSDPKPIPQLALKLSNNLHTPTSSSSSYHTTTLFQTKEISNTRSRRRRREEEERELLEKVKKPFLRRQGRSL